MNRLLIIGRPLLAFLSYVSSLVVLKNLDTSSFLLLTFCITLVYIFSEVLCFAGNLESLKNEINTNKFIFDQTNGRLKIGIISSLFLGMLLFDKLSFVNNLMLASLPILSAASVGAYSTPKNFKISNSIEIFSASLFLGIRFLYCKDFNDFLLVYFLENSIKFICFFITIILFNQYKFNIFNFKKNNIFNKVKLYGLGLILMLISNRFEVLFFQSQESYIIAIVIACALPLKSMYYTFENIYSRLSKESDNKSLKKYFIIFLISLTVIFTALYIKSINIKDYPLIIIMTLIILFESIIFTNLIIKLDSHEYFTVNFKRFLLLAVLYTIGTLIGWNYLYIIIVTYFVSTFNTVYIRNKL